MNLTRAAEDLRTVFPQLGTVGPLRVVGSGFGSIVVETAEGALFRIGKDKAVARAYAMESRLLPSLAARVPLPIPELRWYAGTSALFPSGVIGYPKLEGTPLLPASLSRLDAARIASDLGQFLVALHRFPVEEAKALGVPGPVGNEQIRARGERVLPVLRRALSTSEYRVVLSWWDALLGDVGFWIHEPALRHGDLWYENILVDETGHHVTGVIDFDDAAIGDPVQDFATLLYLGEPFTRRVVAAYLTAGGTLGGHFAHRVQRWWELREFNLPDDPAELSDQLRKLRHGPIFEAARPVFADREGL